MPEPVKSRAYRSPVREEGARQTRARIIEAATALFLAQGYARVSLRRVAERAGVSQDLIFHVFGNKRGLLRAVLDAGIGGDDEDVAFLDRDEPQRMRAETDQRRQVSMLARGIAVQLARIRPIDDMLRNAAAVDEEIASLRDDVQLRQRREAMTTVTTWLAARGPLALEQDLAATTLWALTGPDLHRMLVDEAGLGTEEYVGWLKTMIVSALLPDTGAHM